MGAPTIGYLQQPKKEILLREKELLICRRQTGNWSRPRFLFACRHTGGAAAQEKVGRGELVQLHLSVCRLPLVGLLCRETRLIEGGDEANFYTYPRDEPRQNGPGRAAVLPGDCQVITKASESINRATGESISPIRWIGCNSWWFWRVFFFQFYYRWSLFSKSALDRLSSLSPPLIGPILKSL